MTVLAGLLEEGLVKGQEEKDLRPEVVVIGDWELQVVTMD